MLLLCVSFLHVLMRDCDVNGASFPYLNLASFLVGGCACAHARMRMDRGR